MSSLPVLYTVLYLEVNRTIVTIRHKNKVALTTDAVFTIVGGFLRFMLCKLFWRCEPERYTLFSILRYFWLKQS